MMEDLTPLVDFIDREEELEQVNAAVRRWGDKKIVCVIGKGGIGKTRLLTEIRHRHVTAPKQFDEPIDEQPVTIALIQEFTHTDWSRELLDGMYKTAEELGVKLIEFDANFDISRMANQMEQAIEQRPDAIILRLGTHDELLPALRHALDEGIKVISFDNYLPENRITTRVIQDYFDSDTQLAKQMAQEMDYNGNILAIYDEGQSIQWNRYRLLQNVMRPHPEISIVDSHVNISMDLQTIHDQIMDTLKSDLKIKAIWVAWDEFTQITINAVKEAGCREICVYGYGLLAEQADTMLEENSIWRATVDSCPIEVGKYIVSIATMAALNENLERHYAFKTELIDRESLIPLLVDEKLPPNWIKFEMPWMPRLQKRQNAFSKERRLLPPLPILDFDDFANRAPQNIISKILLSLNKDSFEFRQQYPAYTDEDINQFDWMANYEDFERIFNEISKSNRILMFFDTVDDNNQVNILQEVVKLLVNANNFVCVIAGRHTQQLYDQLVQNAVWKSNVEKIDLQPLKEKFGEEYLQKKQKIVGVELDPTLMHNLLLLASGRPILMDLAVDWLARDIPLEWLKSKETSELEKELAEEDREEKIREFEYHLIRHIGEGRRELDWLFLIMARIYPLNIPMIEQIRQVQHLTAEQLFEEAQSYTFVKRLPDGRIKLHDVMQDMIADRLWPEIDPDEDRRKHDSHLAVQYYQTRIYEIDAALEKDASHSPIVKEKLFQELASARGKYLQHLFYLDFEDATRKFKDMFESDTRLGRFSSRQVLLDAVEPYINDLPFDDKYHIRTRQIRHLIQQRNYAQAWEILIDLPKAGTLSPEQELGLLTNKANYFIQTGKLEEADQLLDEAQLICHTNPDLQAQHLGTVLNTRGWVCRQMGKNKMATEYYEKALEQANDPLKVAAIQNNAGYVYALDGKYDAALLYCESSLKLRRENKYTHGEGLSCTTLGDIYRNKGEYQEAIDYFNKAIEIFTPENDATWLAYAYSRRGAVRRLMNDLASARRDLNESINFNVVKELPWIYHVMGCVSWNEEKLDDALNLFDRSQILAKSFHDIHTQVNNIVGSAEVFYNMWKRSAMQRPDLLDLIEEKMKELTDLLKPGYDFPHHRGRLLRVLGDISFDKKDYPNAMQRYAEAYALLGRRTAGYGRRTFSQELDHIEESVLYLADNENQPQAALEWCKYFKNYWTERIGDIMQAEGLITKCTMLETKIRLNTAKKAGGHHA